MAEPVAIAGLSRVPDVADHVALRTLIKYMSGVLGAPYKSIGEGTDISEDSIKGYVNDKSSKSDTTRARYATLLKRCADLMLLHKSDTKLDGYVLHILRHLYGDAWLRAAGFAIPNYQFEAGIDGALASWHDVSSEETAEIESRFSGLWRVFRPSSPRVLGSIKGVELNCSLLNIRPRKVTGGTLCGFRWYYLGRGEERDHRRTFEGYVLPNSDRIEFFGRLSTNRHNRPLSLMIWSFVSNFEIQDHATVANGLSMSLNSAGAPVSARMRAIFIEGSYDLEGEEFRKRESAKARSSTTLVLHPLIRFDH